MITLRRKYNLIPNITKRLSIQNRIFLYYIIIILISLMAISYFSTKVSTDAIIEKAQNSSFRELALISKNIGQLVENINNYSVTLSIDYRLQQLLKENNNSPYDPASRYNATYDLTRITSSIKGLNNNISSCDVMTLDGTLFDIGSYTTKSITPFLTTELIQEAHQKKTPIWVGPYKLDNKFAGTENVFLLLKAVTDLNSPISLGTAIFFIKESQLSSIYLDNLEKGNTVFYILDQSNKILSSSKRENLYMQFDKVELLNNNSFKQLVSKKFIISKSNGTQSLFTIQSFNKLNWKIISIVPLKDITMETNVINRLILTIGIICLVIAFIASFILSRSISKPILKLVKIMKRIKNGDMNIRIDFDSNDEIGLLGNGFNSLMDKIKVLVDKIIIEQKAKSEYEFLLLQSQIKPHFLYNTLETISSFIKLNMKENALTSIQNLASFYRISLSDGKDIITVEEESELIESYLRIQKFRYIKYIDFEISMDKNILKANIPKLTLQPLVENAIYHGIKPKREKGCIQVKGYQNETSINIEITDNGVGMPEEKIRQILQSSEVPGDKKDFGLSSVISRIKILFGNSYGIRIESKLGEYTKVTVILPLFNNSGGDTNV